MKFIRFAAVIGITILTAVVPASALAGGTFGAPTFGSSSSLTRKAPSRLTPAAQVAKAGSSGGDPKAEANHGDPSSAAHASATLPYTGFDLLPETLIGVGLVGAGFALRKRRA